MSVMQRRDGTTLHGKSAHALVMMVDICARKKRIFCGATTPSSARILSSALRSCVFPPQAATFA